MKGEDDEGNWEEICKELDLLEEQYRKGGKAALTQNVSDAPSPLPPAFAEGESGTGAGPGGVVATASTPTRFREQTQQKVRPRDSLDRTLGPPILGRFNVKNESAKESLPKESDDSPEDKFQQTVQKKDGEIWVLRQRLQRVEEEKNEAFRRSMSLNDTSRVTTLKEELEVVKKETSQLRIKLEHAEKELEEAQKEARENLQRSELLQLNKAIEPVERSEDSRATGRHRTIEYPQILNAESAITFSPPGPRKPKIRRTSISTGKPPSTQDRKFPGEPGIPPAAVAKADKQVQTPNFSAATDTEDLSHPGLDQIRLETTSVFKTRQIEIMKLRSSAAGAALYHALLDGDDKLKSSLEPLQNSSRREADREAALSLIEALGVFSKSSQRSIRTNLPLAPMDDSAASLLTIGRILALAQSTDDTLIDLFEGQTGAQDREATLLLLITLLEKQRVGESMLPRVIKIAGKLLSSDSSLTVRERALYVLLRIVKDQETGLPAVVSSSVNIVARCALLLDQLLDEMFRVDSTKLATNPTGVSGNSRLIALTERALVLEAILLRTVSQEDQRVHQHLGTTRLSLLRSLHTIGHRRQVFQRDTVAEAETLLGILASS